MRLRFLIVEDDALTARGYARVFWPFGDVTVVTTKIDALNRLATDVFDGIIVDIRLPDGCGFDVLAASPNTRAVICTGYTDAEIVNRAHDAHADIIAKPEVHQRLAKWAAQLLPARSGLTAGLDRWRVRYALSTTELTNFEFAIAGLTQKEIAHRRGVSIETVRTESKHLLAKTRDKGWMHAVARFLREAR